MPACFDLKKDAMAWLSHPAVRSINVLIWQLQLQHRFPAREISIPGLPEMYCYQ
jgi:hypothetical protein